MAAARAERQLGWPGRIILALLLVPGVLLALYDPIQALSFAAYGLVAALLIVRRPSNAIGPLLMVLAYGYIMTSLPIGGIDPDAALAGDLALSEDLAIWITAWYGTANFTAYLALALLFPSGRFPVGRWRRPAMGMMALAVAITAMTAFAPTIEFNPSLGTSPLKVPNPFAILPGLPVWSLAIGSEIVFVVITMLVVAVGSMVVRYRRASGVLRLQLKWLVAALAFLVTAVLFGLAMLAAFDGRAGVLGWLPAIVAFPTVPAAVGVAILRYHLYEIDRIISRTIGWTLVTGALVAVFAVSVVALQVALASFTQSPTIAVAASTLIAYAAFQPLRRRIQGAIDRRFDRARYDAERTTVAFAGRLRDEVDIDAVADDLRSTVATSVRPAVLAVWLREPSGTDR